MLVPRIRHRAGNKTAAIALDFNWIEQAFGKLKALSCKAAEWIIPHLCRRIGQLLGVFTAAESANFAASAGYASK